MATSRRYVTRVNKRNQVTIPAELLGELGIGPGDEVEIGCLDSGLRLRPAKSPVDALFGLFHDPARRPMSDEELEAAIKEAREEAATRRYVRSLPPRQ